METPTKKARAPRQGIFPAVQEVRDEARYLQRILNICGKVTPKCAMRVLDRAKEAIFDAVVAADAKTSD